MKTPQLPERLNAFQLRSCARQRCLISPLLFSIVLAVLPSAIIEERDPYDPAVLPLGIYLKKQKHLFEKIHLLQGLHQHYLQLTRYGSNLSVDFRMNG